MGAVLCWFSAHHQTTVRAARLFGLHIIHETSLITEQRYKRRGGTLLVFYSVTTSFSLSLFLSHTLFFPSCLLFLLLSPPYFPLSDSFLSLSESLSLSLLPTYSLSLFFLCDSRSFSLPLSTPILSISLSPDTRKNLLSKVSTGRLPKKAC